MSVQRASGVRIYPHDGEVITQIGMIISCDHHTSTQYRLLLMAHTCHRHSGMIALGIIACDHHTSNQVRIDCC